MNIIENISNRFDMLTRKQKEIARYLLDNPADICYISIAGLCEQTGCAPVTILKFCKAVGVPNFIELKKEFRNYNQNLINQFSVSSYDVPTEITRSDSKIPFLETICQEELAIIVHFYNQIDLKNIWDIANSLAQRQVVYLFAHDASLTMALFLKNRLDILNMNVVMVDLSEMKKVEYVLNQITEHDAAVVFSYPNYYYSVSSVAGHIKKKSGELILLSNSADCPVTPLADHAVFCETRTKIFHNSWILPMIVLNLLTSTLALVIEEK